MLKIDKYIFKEGSRFFVDIAEWKNGLEVGIEEGDIIKYNFEGKRYTAKVVNFSKETDIFELINVKEVVKI
jgi:hypothetical protein